MIRLFTLIVLLAPLLATGQDSLQLRLDSIHNSVVGMFYSGDRIDGHKFRTGIDEAKSLALQLGDRKMASHLLRMEGLYAANILGDDRSGHSRIDSSFTLAFEIQDSTAISRGHSAKGYLFLYRNQLDKALEHYLKSLEYVPSGDELEKFQAYYALAHCYERLDEKDEAEYFYNKSLGVPIKELNYLPKGIYYKMMADAYHAVDRYIDAEFFIEKFLEAPEESQSSFDLMKIHFMKGAIESAKEADDVALEHYLTSLKYGARIQDSILLPEIRFNLSLTYSLMGEADSSMKYMRLAIDQFELQNRKHDLFDAYSALGDIFYNNASYSRANKEYKLASAISYELGDTVKILKGLSNVADAQYSMRGFSQSSSTSMKILGFRNAEVDDIGSYIIRAYMNIGDCYFEGKKFNNAYEYYEKALEECDHFRMEERKALAYYNMAWVRMEQNKNVDAGILINKGYKVADRHDLRGTMRQICEASNYLKYQLKYEGNLPKICEAY